MPPASTAVPMRPASPRTGSSRAADVDVGARPTVGGPIRVEVTYTSRTDLPLVGRLFPDPELHAAATMRTER